MIKETIKISDNEKVIQGLNEAVDIIKTTLGAKGKFVTILENGKYKVTKDGVSVAKALHFRGLRGIGAEAVKTAAAKTVSQVGDGTTSTSVLLQAMVNLAILHSGGDINSIIKGMDYALEEVLNYIDNNSIELKDDFDKLKQVASIASNSDILGKLIADCYNEVSMDSIITLEKSSYASDTYYEVKRGITFNSGMIHNAFANSHGTKCIYEDCTILIEEKPIRGFSETYQTVLNHSIQEDIPIVIIAPEFEKQFVSICLTNKIKRGLKICLVKAPGFGDNIFENFKDITAYCEGQVDKVVISRENITFFNGETSSLKERVIKLTEQLGHIEDYYESKKLQDRIHNLKGTTGVIFTGGVTKEEQDEEYDRIEDALGSVRAAIVSGYVSGGGLTLYNASKLIPQKKLTDSELIGYNIVLSACKKPLQQGLKNANLVPQAITTHFPEDKKNWGYNVLTDKYCDVIEEGIIDPTAVVKETIINALATTKLIINTKYNLVNVSYDTINP